MSNSALEGLRKEVANINVELLALLSRRAELTEGIQKIKSELGMPTYLPEREAEMLEVLVGKNSGPFSDDTVRRLFKEIFKASVGLMERQKERTLKISRAYKADDLHISVGERCIGSQPMIIAGPCAVESEVQMEQVARFVASRGVGFLRGGAFKPRSSPYSFQGLGVEGLEILRDVGRRHGLQTVTEVMDTRSVGLVCEYADVLQIGARNMYNYDLLREVGRVRKPVLLKRGLSATIDELLWSAEYIACEGNEQVILCERGIRTYETQTRNTLDISAIPLLRQRSYLPVIVDVSHAAGRRDILGPLGAAALAAGANGLMIEVHPQPALARSDNHQQLDFNGFDNFLARLGGTFAAGVKRAQ